MKANVLFIAMLFYLVPIKILLFLYPFVPYVHIILVWTTCFYLFLYSCCGPHDSDMESKKVQTLHSDMESKGHNIDIKQGYKSTWHICLCLPIYYNQKWTDIVFRHCFHNIRKSIINLIQLLPCTCSYSMTWGF